MLGGRWKRGAAIVFAGGMIGALGCAPDLTIGSATSSTGDGGAGTTSTGGAMPGDMLWVDWFPVTGQEVPNSIVLGADGEGYMAGWASDLGGPKGVLDYRLYEQAEGNWLINTINIIYGGPHSASAITRLGKDYFVAGELFGPVNASGEIGTPASKGGSDCLAAKQEGSDLWARAIGSEGFSACAGVVATKEGLFFAGTFSAKLDDEVKGDGAILESKGGYDMFLAKLSLAGEPVNAWQFGDASNQRVHAMQSDGAGDLYLLGSDESGSPDGSTDIVLLRVGQDGKMVGAPRRYGVPGQSERPLALSVAADGTVAIAGTMSVPLDVGGGPLGGAVFVAVFDPQGQHVWSHGLLGDPEALSVQALLLDDAHRLYLGGEFPDSLGLAGQYVHSNGGLDAFYGGLTADGELRFLRSFGDAEDQFIGALAFTKEGTLVAAGHYAGTLQLVGETLNSPGDFDPFILGISP